jgi:predicted DNA-binding ribbon-helix-helix protein
VLEAYVWDSIDSMLQREAVSLDEFCNRVEDARQQSSMASSARLVVLIYFRLLSQINSPPFVDDDLDRLQQEGRLRAPAPADPPIPLLPLALRRFAQDEAHVA